MSGTPANPGSMVFAPFSSDELSALRRLARRPAHFQVLALAVQRLQVLRTLRPEALDREASLGALRAEVAALSALACCPAPDSASRLWKAQLFSAAQHVGDGNLAPLLSASLALDAMRLDRDPTSHPQQAIDATARSPHSERTP